MAEFIRKLFDSDFLPHGHCYFWRPEIVWLHVISDAAIALAYYSIPLFLFAFLRRRGDVPFRGIFAMFSVFILACGSTHLLEVWTLWHGTYRLAGVVKAVTAVASVATVLALVPAFPKALALRSPREWEEANLLLRNEITQRERAQTEVARLNSALLQQLAQLAELNKELEAFSHSVSHDLRTPLRHIRAFSRLLGQSSGAALDEDSRGHLKGIGMAATHMERLIEGLLNLSRLGRAALRLETVDLTRLVQQVSVDLARDIAAPAIEWRISELPRVRGDRTLLRVVVENLLSNALKYSRTRTPARIEVRGRSEAEGMVLVEVHDNGVGFDMRYAYRLFGVFQRLHSAAEFEGTGIGLATVRRIVHRHGGRVWAEAKLGEGATFYLTLPQSGPDA